MTIESPNNSVANFLGSLSQTSPREEFYDLVAVEAMSSDDQRAVEEALIERLALEDARAAMTLAKLGCSRALPALEKMAASSATAGTFARRAVYTLRPDEDAAQAVVSDALSGSPYERIAAIDALIESESPQLLVTLEQCLFTEDSTIRRHSAEQLISALGLSSRAQCDGSELESVARLNQLCWLISADLAALFQFAANELKYISAQMRAGKTAAELDLSYSSNTSSSTGKLFTGALREPEALIPIDAILAAFGDERAGFECILALRLQPSIQDPRAPAALADLGAQWAIPALEESVLGLESSHPFTQAVDSAVKLLRASKFTR